MWLVAGQSAHALQAASDRNPHDGAIPPSELTEIVQQYCVVCHNARRMTGNLSLQNFSVDNAAGEAGNGRADDPEAPRGHDAAPPGQRRPGVTTRSSPWPKRSKPTSTQRRARR